MAISILKDGEKIMTFGVCKFPDRKQFCLYRMIGNIITPLAYFKKDTDAKEFEDFIHSLIPGNTA